MGNKVAPTGFQIYLIYKCECKTEHALTLQEAKGEYTIVCSTCNKRHSIKPVKSVKALVNFSTSKIQSKRIENPKDTLVSEAYRVLKCQGYSLEDILRVQKEIGAKDKKVLIREFLAKQK